MKTVSYLLKMQDPYELMHHAAVLPESVKVDLKGSMESLCSVKTWDSSLKLAVKLYTMCRYTVCGNRYKGTLQTACSRLFMYKIAEHCYIYIATILHQHSDQVTFVDRHDLLTQKAIWRSGLLKPRHASIWIVLFYIIMHVHCSYMCRYVCAR